jgi:hypothetical protein
MPKKAIYNNSEVFEMVEIFIGGSLVEKRSVANFNTVPRGVSRIYTLSFSYIQ